MDEIYVLLDLRMGTMFAFFHIVGNLPFDSERVKSLASENAMLFAVVLSRNTIWASCIKAIDEM